MTSQDDVSIARKLQRTKRRLLLEFVNAPPPTTTSSSVGTTEHDPEQTTEGRLRVRGSGSNDDSYEEVSMARKLQRMKRRLLLGQASQHPLQNSQDCSTSVVVLVVQCEGPPASGPPATRWDNKPELEASYLAKAGLLNLDKKGMNDLPRTNIQVAKMA